MLKQKFIEVKQLIEGFYFSQAVDESQNGANQVDEAKSASNNFMQKLHEAFGEAEILDDLQAFLNEQFGE